MGMPPENIFERSRKNDKSDEISPIHDGMLPENLFTLFCWWYFR